MASMRLSRSIALLSLALAGACATPAAHRQCREVLERQAAAWNRGDLDAFCADYWRSEDVVFASQSGVEVGWDAMHARYRRRYPDRAAMGRLAFSELRFATLAEDTVVARGRWRLQREVDAPTGRFVVVLRELDDGWRVVLDYTTSDGDG